MCALGAILRHRLWAAYHYCIIAQCTSRHLSAIPIVSGHLHRVSVVSAHSMARDNGLNTSIHSVLVDVRSYAATFSRLFYTGSYSV